MTKPINSTDYNDFRVDELWFGYQSYDKENNPLIRSHHLEDCIYWTERYLASKEDGEWSSSNRVLNDGVVGGKL